MDYLARAREASRRWREANGLPADGDLDSPSSLYSHSLETKSALPETEEENGNSRARGCEEKEANKEKEEVGSRGSPFQDRAANKASKAKEEASEPPRPTREPIPDLDPRAVCEHFGVELPEVVTAAVATAALARAMLTGKVDPKDVTTLHTEVWAAVCAIEWEISTGALKRQPRLVRGRPLADWLDLGDVARLLRAGGRS